ncbi:MAG: sigma-70 family RNA polymerase sigma factor, partial [Jatrophihabitantaceae bacterium]
MTRQVAVEPVMRLRRSLPATARQASGVEVGVPDTSFESVTAQSLEDFARQHGLGLTRFAYLVSGDRHRADDLVQDVLLAMHRRFGDQLDIEQPLAYARRAIVNANISWSRRRFNTEVLTAVDVDRPVTDADPGSGDELWQLLKELPHRQRVVLVMRYYLGYSDGDIAETLGCR